MWIACNIVYGEEVMHTGFSSYFHSLMRTSMHFPHQCPSCWFDSGCSSSNFGWLKRAAALLTAIRDSRLWRRASPKIHQSVAINLGHNSSRRSSLKWCSMEIPDSIHPLLTITSNILYQLSSILPKYGLPPGFAHCPRDGLRPP